MDYLVVGLVAFVFLFGIGQLKPTAALLHDPKQRQSLTYRVAGFFAMSFWIHFIPLILFTIYMRENHFLAPEVFEEAAQTVVVSTYLTTKIFSGTLALSWGAVYYIITKPITRGLNYTSTLKWTGILHSVIGVSMYAGYMFSIWSADVSRHSMQLLPHRPDLFYFVLIISLVVSGYLVFAIMASIELTLKYWFTPYLLISIVSIAMLLFPKAAAHLIESELNNFSNGGIGARIAWKGEKINGRLLLLTKEAAYLEVPRYPSEPYPSSEYFGCVLRIPVREALIETSIFYLNNNSSSAQFCNLKSTPMSE